MKAKLQSIVEAGLRALQQEGVLPQSCDIARVQIGHPKQKEHGDFACNIAMMLAKPAGIAPRALAEQLVEKIGQQDPIEKIDIAGPGFINFFVRADSQREVIATVLSQGEQYGHRTLSAAKKVHIEFVSANPTGPLHVGHGRGAAYGSALVSMLAAGGYPVHAEYYVNDAGRQMDILAVSVWLRYLEAQGQSLTFPANGYQGDYVKDIAQRVVVDHGEALLHPTTAVFAEVPADLDQAGKGDKEAHIDGLITNAKQLLGENYAAVHAAALSAVLADIQEDLAEFQVHYDEWFSEKQLMDSHAVEAALSRLDQQGLLYKKSGATWFKSTQFGDDKDRVVVRDNGQTTYFASDAAYLLNKLDRGYDQVVYVLGADHHGYVPRLKALMQAFGFDANRLKIPIVQFAVLYRGGEQVKMSTRSGSFVTLRELRDEVGVDAARFFYLMRKCEQHLDFDLDLAKSQSNDNPVYYIQYAHARICSLMRQLDEKGWQFDQQQGLAALDQLTTEAEKALMAHLAKFAESVANAADRFEPHLIAYYLRDLAHYFHSYYNGHQVLVEDDLLRNARLCLLQAVKQVLHNALTLLGLSSPEQM